MSEIKERKTRVLRLLRAANGGWVPGPDIASPEYGGSEGLRRLRELRQDGYRIENRKMANSAAFEYRLVEGQEPDRRGYLDNHRTFPPDPGPGFTPVPPDPDLMRE